jgi:hypothetical protein
MEPPLARCIHGVLSALRRRAARALPDVTPHRLPLHLARITFGSLSLQQYLNYCQGSHGFVRPHVSITDEASPLALLSTHLIRGEQCAEAPAGRGSVTLSLSGRGGGQTRLGSVLSVELSWLLIDQAASERPSLRTAPQR